LRNAAANGRDAFAPKNDQLKRNQFGGVLGGPLKKDKVFFFAGFQGTTTRQTPLAGTAYVPTAPMRAGDFSAYVNPVNGCPSAAAIRSIVDGNGRLTFPLSAAAVNIAGRLPQTSDPWWSGRRRHGSIAGFWQHLCIQPDRRELFSHFRQPCWAKQASRKILWSGRRGREECVQVIFPNSPRSMPSMHSNLVTMQTSISPRRR